MKISASYMSALSQNPLLIKVLNVQKNYQTSHITYQILDTDARGKVSTNHLNLINKKFRAAKTFSGNRNTTPVIAIHSYILNRKTHGTSKQTSSTIQNNNGGVGWGRLDSSIRGLTSIAMIMRNIGSSHPVLLSSHEFQIGTERSNLSKLLMASEEPFFPCVRCGRTQLFFVSYQFHRVCVVLCLDAARGCAEVLWCQMGCLPPRRLHDSR